MAETYNYDYSTVQYNLSPVMADLVLELGAKIPDEDIYTKEGDRSYGREDEPHITIKYGLDVDDPDEIRNTLRDAKDAMGCLDPAGTSLFQGEEYDVVKFDVIATPQLEEMHKMLSELPNKDEHQNYQAHITVAYVKKGEGKKYVGLQPTQRADKNVLAMFIGACEFRNREGQRTEITFEYDFGSMQRLYPELVKLHRDNVPHYRGNVRIKELKYQGH